MYKILVLGGYGNFGARIVKSLAIHPNISLFIAGRNSKKANELLDSLENHHKHQIVQLDQNSKTFADDLKALNVDSLIHTSGPYQGQQYTVAEACIQTKTNYIDLADGREFVEGFASLDNNAKENGVLLVTGASTLPGVSSAVIQNLKDEFNTIDSIRICISPGNKAPRGESTIAAVLSYCGKPIECWVEGQWQTLYGWQDLHSHRFPILGTRWLGLCDVPDLSLFPKQYEEVKTVLFHAALETKFSQLGFWIIAAMTRMGFFQNPSDYASFVYKIGEMTNFMGTPDGGMFIKLEGIDKNNNSHQLTWYLTALNGHGPEIPTIPAIILARKLAEDQIQVSGALPCFELITLDEFQNAVSHLDISWEVMRQ